MKNVISVSKASKQYPNCLALNDVSLSLAQSEVLSILGPNGAGKTTLINALLGKISLDAGELKLFDLKPGEMSVKRRIGAMLQVSGLPEQLTIKEHIQLFRSYYPAPMSYEQIMQYSGLSSIENQRSKSLSGGQKQRLMFALAICGDPEILFLDEPTVGMDIEARKKLWKAISELRNKGKSIILTTHYLEEADQLSDRIIMLNKGKIIHQGSPEAIKATTQHKKIICKSSLTQAKLTQLAAVIDVEQFGETVHIKSSDAVLTLKALFQQDFTVNDLTVTGGALEDAFEALNQPQTKPIAA